MLVEEKELEDFLCTRYQLPALTKDFKNRIKQSNIGGLQVTTKYLLGCWKTMQFVLDKQRKKNIARGKNLTNLELLYYDLTIVLNKYSDYVRHINTVEKQNQELKETTELSFLVENAKKTKIKHNELKNISSLVDELFFADEEDKKRGY